jgi:thiol-disulfide isomerase/thioredoxin
MNAYLNQKLISKKSFLVSTLFIFIIIYSCDKQDEDFIVFSGKIENVEPESNGRKYLDVSSNKNSWRIQLNDDNTFRDTIRNDEGLFSLMDGKYPYQLFFSKSKEYSIHYDANNFRTGNVVVGGDGKHINQYFVEKFQQRVFLNPGNTDRTEEEFRKKISEKRSQNSARLEKATLPKYLKESEAKLIKYEYLKDLNIFLVLKKESDSTFNPSKISINELDIDYLNEEDFKNISDYRLLVFDYSREQIKELAKENIKENSYYSYEQNTIKLIEKTIPNEYIKNYMISGFALSNIKKVKDIDSYYIDFKSYYTGKDENLKSQMFDSYTRLNKLSKDSSSPEFVDYMNYKGGVNSLKDYRGKYVYIDFWATWCGSCFGEMSYMKEIEKEYQDKNIIFISISIDDNITSWKRVIKKKEMEGIQLLAKKEENGFVEQFAVYGIPRYVFIDPKGTIINYEAPRPSNKEELKKLFSSVGL